jgi:3-phenylpropionate/trans-cinnamate dioxygenase ferredoxin reductase subunit
MSTLSYGTDLAMSSHEVQRVVIVGAGLAGLRTAEKLRRGGYDAKITLVGAERHLPYDRPPLSKKLLVQSEHPEDPVLLRATDRYPALDAEVVTDVLIGRLDLPDRTVSTTDGRTWSWDRLVIATGVRPRSAPGWSEAGVHLLRTFDDCLRLRTALRDASRLVVIGGGVLGCEVAAGARGLGLEVSLVEPLATPLYRAVGPQMGSYVASLHHGHGVQLHAGVGVSSLHRDGRSTEVTLTDGRQLEADVVFAAIGSVPNTEWLDDSGLALGDGVLCDATGTSSDPDVLAVGDVANMPHGMAAPSRLEHWTSAADTASLVAGNVVLPPQQRRELTEVPYFWTDQYDTKLQTLGVPAAQDDLTVVVGTLDSGSFVALHSRGDVVTGVSAVGHAAILNRCRPLVAAGADMTAALASGPWVRPPATQA